MSAAEHRFRSAAFGGFHRQDVIDYIELLTKTYNSKLEQLKGELEAEQGNHASLERKLADAELALAAAVTERSRMDTELSAVRSTQVETHTGQEETSARVAELETALAALEGALADWQAKCEKFEAAADSYAALKDRTATIELEAHQRAHVIVTRAEERAAQIRTLCAQWVTQLQAGYAALRADVDNTITITLHDLRRTCHTVEQMAAQFAEYDKQVGQMGEQSPLLPQGKESLYIPD